MRTELASSPFRAPARAVLRMHANGATPGRLARFATDASRWATRNALICAEKDLAAATDGLASMIRHDSLNDLTDLDRHVHDGSPLSFSEYQTSETRRRIAPATPSPPCAVRSAA